MKKERLGKESQYLKKFFDYTKAISRGLMIRFEKWCRDDLNSWH